jgi:hypothetical protein
MAPLSVGKWSRRGEPIPPVRSAGWRRAADCRPVGEIALPVGEIALPVGESIFIKANPTKAARQSVAFI